MTQYSTLRGTALPSLRRLAWRVGRRVYCAARGEPGADDIATDGEAYVQRCLVKSISPCSELCVFDIGANCGDWSASFLRALSAEHRTHAKTRLHSFEPVPATRQMLLSRLASMKGSEIAEVHAFAMSNECGAAPMAILSDTGGTNSLSLDTKNTRRADNMIEVEKTTLADFCRQRGIGHVNLVKSDTEGHDLSVLRGAREILAAGRLDLFQFEYNHTWVFSRAFLKDVFELVEGLPYRVARIRPASIEILDGWHPELERFFHANYLLVREPALAWFDVRFGTFDGSNTYA
ncbi:FkbM family methyltransferase [Methylocystis hirsuta]|uniref:FkbM family methyltransferase n=1 Tax=Methylocystis hirsuta TaxID=369798 RepID=A0A3M9XK85_9HYPH|nr:FkbM family methyltransferase [Methylocystis hirsuta]